MQNCEGDAAFQAVVQKVRSVTDKMEENVLPLSHFHTKKNKKKKSRKTTKQSRKRECEVSSEHEPAMKQLKFSLTDANEAKGNEEKVVDREVKTSERLVNSIFDRESADEESSLPSLMDKASECSGMSIDPHSLGLDLMKLILGDMRKKFAT